MPITKPNYTDAPHYFHYFMDLVPENDLIAALKSCQKETEALFSAIDLEKEDYAYQAGKWSIKQVFRHILDCEIIFLYRILRFSRFDDTELPGFDENAYIDNVSANSYSLPQLLKEYHHLRNTMIALLETLTEEMLDVKGKANGKSVTARAMGYMIVGHNLHHCAVIRQKYLTL